MKKLRLIVAAASVAALLAVPAVASASDLLDKGGIPNCPATSQGVKCDPV